jgi:predicted nucleic acid-binding protein
MEIVADASITLSWCFPDEQTPLSLTVLDRLNAGDTALVPAFWSVEVLNSLLVGEKRDVSRHTRRRLFCVILRRSVQLSTMHPPIKCSGPCRSSAASKT